MFPFFFVQVNLVDGLPSILYNETCTAGAGTIILEFGILSRLLGDPVFENFARKAVEALWKRRSLETGLLGEFTLLHPNISIHFLHTVPHMFP